MNIKPLITLAFVLFDVFAKGQKLSMPPLQGGLAADTSRVFITFQCPPSIRKDNYPLVIVDGQRVDFAKLEILDTADIYNIRVIGPKNDSIKFYGKAGRDGVIIVDTKDKIGHNWAKKIMQRYPDGRLKIRQTKSGRTEYFENGKKKVICTWQQKKQEARFREKGKYNLIVSETEYDEEGEIIRREIYEERSWLLPWPWIGIKYADWIILAVKYENGKEISKVENVDAKTCFGIK